MSKWSEHVRKKEKKNKLTYREANSNMKCQKEYKNKKNKTSPKKKNKTSPKKKNPVRLNFVPQPMPEWMSKDIEEKMDTEEAYHARWDWTQDEEDGLHEDIEDWQEKIDLYKELEKEKRQHGIEIGDLKQEDDVDSLVFYHTEGMDDEDILLNNGENKSMKDGDEDENAKGLYFTKEPSDDAHEKYKELTEELRKLYDDLPPVFQPPYD